MTNYEFSFGYVTELLKSNDFEDVEVGGALLREYDRNIVFSRRDWTRELLNHGKAKGEKFFGEIRDSLFFMAIPMSKQGTAGEPMPEDVALVEDSKKAIEDS